MAGVDDQEAVAYWLFARLSTDVAVTALLGTGSACRLYPEVAPQLAEGGLDTDRPFAVYSFNRSRTRQFAGSRQRGFSDQWLLLQVSDDGEGFDRANAVLQVIDASLTASTAQGSVTVGGTSHWVTAVGQGEPMRRAELGRGGVSYRTVSRIYRIQVS